MQRFQGKIVMVTGASRGIGKETALRFASEGAQLILASNDAAELKETEEEFKQLGYWTLGLVMDVSNADQVNEETAKAIESLGRIDILINNAGIAAQDDFLDISEKSWKRMLDVNLNGMFYVGQRVSRQMADQGGGVIVNMASTNGLVGEAKYAHYNASKGGVVLLTKTMAIELGVHNIRVNAVCPGYIQTPMSEAMDSPEFVQEYIRTKIPLGRAGKAADVAGVFAFLASDDAGFITGETIVVDGGQLAF
ncbi:SDR family NAD(P)-dependent oxidoreductase [Paenibacillus eucommiae]|uniref:3-oxoacyl-[acyl-carrier protein] reductase n=1 Tax=Paenibacillus eucommiae TaxID=1355755 RepID=A0ABS4JAN8_9BACL|nr:SDR family NAD(P)-dependent oxidoreductase [Paenibacillus eucommiae]MBP1996870.1 3-oxoacyl-[acyl-carrier protein] reductase [Paenibacillus eucommiae]